MSVRTCHKCGESVFSFLPECDICYYNDKSPYDEEEE